MLTNYHPPLDPYLSILYQDNDIIVCDKPSGLLSVRGKAKQHQDSLQFRCEQVWPTLGIVHRLDMGTSGIMVMALNKQAHRSLSTQFQQRKIHKTYIARVYGRPSMGSGKVEIPLKVDWPNRPKQKVCYTSGKSALTYWKLLEVEGKTSRIKLNPVTGRSHQLRVHMAEIGLPILGDKFYAHPSALEAAERLNLHAYQIEFRHPVTQELISLTSEVPF